MTIVGFHFSKISIEQKEPLRGKIDIGNNISIKNVEQQELPFGAKAKQTGLKFMFTFTTRYLNETKKDIAEIMMEGDILYLAPVEEAKSIVDGWKKDKKVSNQEIMASVLNTALARCNIQALLLSDTLGLPSPVPLPTVQVNKPEAKEKKK